MGLAENLRDAAHGKLEELDFIAMVTTEPDPIDWIVEGMVARGTVTLLVGREKSSKSLLALFLAAGCARAPERHWPHGLDVGGLWCRPAVAFVLDTENARRIIHQRIIGTGLGEQHKGRLTTITTRGFSLEHDEDVAELDAAIEAAQADLVVLDPWRKLWDGDEVDPGEVSRVLDRVRTIAECHDVGVILIHHAKKGGGDDRDAFRGTTAVTANVDSTYMLEKIVDDEDPDRRRLVHTQCRYARERPPRWLRLLTEQRGADELVVGWEVAQPLMAPGKPKQRKAAGSILGLLAKVGDELDRNGDEPAVVLSNAELCRRIDRNERDGTVARALADLERRGLAVKLERVGWRITSSGSQWILDHDGDPPELEGVA